MLDNSISRRFWVATTIP